MSDQERPEALTRREITARLRRRLGLSGREAGLIIDGFLEALAGQLAEGGVVTLSGLGRWAGRPTPARPGRNPATGREVTIPAHIRPAFTLSRSLRKILKDEEPEF
ncbi:MAG: HU family DNA-binding protein [Candidatus Adiutrix sp.]|jgi:nucleoid DNA-binding protein|nr:HU family DNA-binding protein [Candidatus Adiutrix sp.]